jgi:hypothetical protein
MDGLTDFNLYSPHPGGLEGLPRRGVDVAPAPGGGRGGDGGGGGGGAVAIASCVVASSSASCCSSACCCSSTSSSSTTPRSCSHDSAWSVDDAARRRSRRGGGGGGTNPTTPTLSTPPATPTPNLFVRFHVVPFEAFYRLPIQQRRYLPIAELLTRQRLPHGLAVVVVRAVQPRRERVDVHVEDPVLPLLVLLRLLVNVFGERADPSPWNAHLSTLSLSFAR